MSGWDDGALPIYFFDSLRIFTLIIGGVSKATTLSLVEGLHVPVTPRAMLVGDSSPGGATQARQAKDRTRSTR
ncbi:hypothetical protein ElyMa_004552700 [Elysia marginata]|uniref:Uncharacterized protein n=1 Tax=Elysia marginata TaxID=1093978 RepID=A0AAV4HQD8_9GAST|nr:hypothetical protein ElyMa_004552700 [Elysia marginata]